MIFVTTGQRIAVENFSKGVIYKVTFTDESIAYMMCVGIGKDFVMLQSADPSLFSLTMQSASRVSTIDIHDPTPPEPPTPIENALQYQTGEPPFTFTTTGNKLFSWYIEGACGDKTANLLDNDNFENGGWDATAGRVPTKNTNPQRCRYSTSISLSTNKLYYDFKTFNVNIIQIGENGRSLGGTGWITGTGTITLTSETTDFTLIIANADTTTNIDYTDVQAANLTIDYGYKIPISCNSHTETIYLDEPLAEGEKLYSVNTDTEIVTDIGENTLTVETTDTPGMQIVYDIYAEG